MVLNLFIEDWLPLTNKKFALDNNYIPFLSVAYFIYNFDLQTVNECHYYLIIYILKNLADQQLRKKLHTN